MLLLALIRKNNALVHKMPTEITKKNVKICDEKLDLKVSGWFVKAPIAIHQGAFRFNMKLPQNVNDFPGIEEIIGAIKNSLSEAGYSMDSPDEHNFFRIRYMQHIGEEQDKDAVVREKVEEIMRVCRSAAEMKYRELGGGGFVKRVEAERVAKEQQLRESVAGEVSKRVDDLIAGGLPEDPSVLKEVLTELCVEASLAVAKGQRQR